MVSKTPPNKLTFEEMKTEFRRIQREFSELLFNAETFDQGRLILRTEQILVPPIVDKLRLMNDLRNLDSIELYETSGQKENQK